MKKKKLKLKSIVKNLAKRVKVTKPMAPGVPSEVSIKAVKVKF